MQDRHAVTHRYPLPPRVESAIRDIAESSEFRQHPCFYAYDLAKVDAQLQSLAQCLPPFCALYYAMKANPHQRLLESLRGYSIVAGIEIASAGEMEAAAAQFSPEQIIFTGPGKTDYELDRAVRVGIGQIHVESVLEATRLSRIATRLGVAPVAVLVRVNADYTLAGAHNRASGASSKFGIDEEVIEEHTRRIMALPSLRVRGFHMFGGSGVLDASCFVDYLQHVFAFVARMQRAGLPVDVIDIGGGFGIDYSGAGQELDVRVVGNAISDLRRSCGAAVERFVLELGRYVVGEAGHYVTEILDIKQSRGKKHLITAGGINHQRRPMAYQLNHPVTIIPRGRDEFGGDAPSVREERVDIGGPLCTQVDYLARDYFIPRAEVGDLVVIHCSGAYGLCFGHVNFLGHPLPAEHFVS